LAGRAFFELMVPDDGRGLTDPELKKLVEFSRQTAGEYGWIEEQGDRAQKILDRMKIPVNLKKFYEAKGYGPENFRNSPQFKAKNENKNEPSKENSPVLPGLATGVTAEHCMANEVKAELHEPAP
jgi:hypothetical protein